MSAVKRPLHLRSKVYVAEDCVLCMVYQLLFCMPSMLMWLSDCLCVCLLVSLCLPACYCLMRFAVIETSEENISGRH